MAALIVLIFALAIWALPVMIIALIAQRLLVNRVHWRISFLIWFIPSLVSLWIIYQQYWTSLEPQMSSVFGLYVAQAMQHQLHLLQWNIGALWPPTWAMWLHSFIAFPLAGVWYEVSYRASGPGNINRTLQLEEQRRQKHAQRSQKQAQRRAKRPPDEAGGMGVMGIPIKRRKDE
jgi:hypothetical protein